jgi:hypothetical protein
MISAAQTTLPWPDSLRYEIRRRAIGEGCEFPNVHVAVVGDGHAWLALPNPSQPQAELHALPASAPACRICSHLLPALLCILMHISSANASMCEDACMVGTHLEALYEGHASRIVVAILHTPTSPQHHLRAATRSYMQLHGANCAYQMRIIGSRNMSLITP